MDAAGVDRAVLVALSCGPPGRCTWRPTIPSGCRACSRSRRPAASTCPAHTATSTPGTAGSPTATAGRSTTGTTGSRATTTTSWISSSARCSASRTRPSRSRTRSPGAARSRPQTLVDTMPDGPAATARSARASSRCARVNCPVMVLHGTDDRIRGIEYGERLAELTGGNLIVAEGGGHGPMARDPVLVNREIRRFADRSCCARWHAVDTPGPRCALSERCTSPRRSGSGMPAGTWRSPTSCESCTPTSRSTGSPRTR